MKYDIFISYCHRDCQIVHRIAKVLSDKGFAVFVDDWSMRLGDEVIYGLECGLEASRMGILMYSEAASQSRWVRTEYHRMLNRANSEGTFRLIPVSLDGTPLPDFASDRVHYVLHDDSEESIRTFVARFESSVTDSASRSTAIRRACPSCSQAIPAYSGFCMFCGRPFTPRCNVCGGAGICSHRSSGGPSMYLEEFEFQCLNPTCERQDSTRYSVGDAMVGYEGPTSCPYCGE